MPEYVAPTKPFDIAIVGGGIGGLAFAVGLLHQGVPVKVYESTKAFMEVGAGLGLSPNSQRAMKLIDPAIYEGFLRRRSINGWDSKKEVWFDFRHGMHPRAGELIHTVKRRGSVGHSTCHRAHFLDELAHLIPAEVAHFGKRLADLEEKEDRVVMTFRDGTTAEASAVVCCDGVKSRGRQILFGEKNPISYAQFTGKYAYRGLIPMDQAVDLLGDELARNGQMYLGEHGHLLTFPIQEGQKMNVVAFRSKANGKWKSEQWVLPMQKEDMYTDFEGWGPTVQKIISLMQKPDIWALFDHASVPTYYRGRICLLGDAAHATTPHQGAGAGMAIEDAFLLSNLLGSIDSAAELEDAFRAYDAVRRPRTQKLVESSREAGRMYEFELEDVWDDIEKIKGQLDERMWWIWDHDLEKDLEDAKKIMRAGPAASGTGGDESTESSESDETQATEDEDEDVLLDLDEVVKMEKLEIIEE